jgi:hypothetical protein
VIRSKCKLQTCPKCPWICCSVSVSLMSASKSLDVVGVGACNADLFTYTTKMPVRGETVTGTSFAQGWGGKNHNQVRGCWSLFAFNG